MADVDRILRDAFAAARTKQVASSAGCSLRMSRRTLEGAGLREPSRAWMLSLPACDLAHPSLLACFSAPALSRAAGYSTASPALLMRSRAEWRSVLVCLCLLLALATSSSVDAQDPNLCSTLADCGDCATKSNGTCGWCSYTGSSQRYGSCLSTRVGGGECAPPEGTWILAGKQCAAPFDVCANYDSNCTLCGTAPWELNCGWCAASSFCVPGSSTGPLSGFHCGAEGWAFLSTGCTDQALCNEETDCASCLQRGEKFGCGWCGSTQRCEIGSISGAADPDCTTPEWYFDAQSQSQCLAPAIDACNDHKSCTNCENAAADLRCGWCSLTGVCSTGSSSGPALTGACSSTPGPANWTLQSCPSDSVCLGATSCSASNQHFGCLWCDEGGENPSGGGGSAGKGQCLPGVDQPIPSFSCPGSITPYTSSCGSSSSTAERYPGAGVWAIAILALTTPLLLVRALLYLTREPRSNKNTVSMSSQVPLAGERSFFGGPEREHYAIESSSGVCRGWLPSLLSLSSLILTVAALVLDEWDASFVRDNWKNQTVGSTSYGLWQESMHVQGQTTLTTSYEARCHGKEGYDAHMCRTLRAAGWMAFVTLVLSAASSALFFLVCIITCAFGGSSHRKDASARSLVLWRLAGLAQVFLLSGLVWWSLSGHLIVHYDESSAGLGPSWFLALAGWTLAIGLSFLAQRNVHHSNGGSNDSSSSSSGDSNDAEQAIADGDVYTSLPEQPHQPLQQHHSRAYPQLEQQQRYA